MNYKKNMKNFLCLLRRLFPTAPANSPAKPAGSNTLPRSGYARSDNGNQSTALPWSLFLTCSIYTTAPPATHAHTILTK